MNKRVNYAYEGNADEMCSSEAHEYTDVKHIMKQGSDRFATEYKWLKPLEWCKNNEEVVLSALRRTVGMSMAQEDRVKLIVALTLLVGTDVDFAFKVFYTLVYGRDDASWTFKIFVTFVQMAISGALHVAGSPLYVVIWLCEH